MWIACVKPQLNASAFKHLQRLGILIHAGQQTLVFDGGFVDLNPQIESEVNTNGTLSQEARSPAGSWSRQRARSRQRSSGQAESLGTDALDQAYRAEFRILAHHYDTLRFEDKDGLWVAVKTRPLGHGGPQAHLLIAAPLNRSIMPRAWAFTNVGPQARLLPLKHTNFGDASICAFTKESQAWKPEDGLLPLVDHYSLWVFKSWHRAVMGWWPGEQVGVCALYRRNEFVAQELCGCRSGKTYADCHLFPDLAVPEIQARNQFRSFFSTEYDDREPPSPIVTAAQSMWRFMPSMALTFSYRICRDEPMISLI